MEQYAAKPSTVGILILDVKTFPETTKLAKALPDSAKIVCKAPPSYRLPAWCVDWAKSRHGKKLAPDAAEVTPVLISCVAAPAPSASATAASVQRAGRCSKIGVRRVLLVMRLLLGV